MPSRSFDAARLSARTLDGYRTVDGITVHMQSAAPDFSRRFLLQLVSIAWLAMLGVDFLLHAGLLAGLYLQPSPFLLSPLTAFQLIPLGYLSLLLLAVLMTWLLLNLKRYGWCAGAVFGLKLGGLTSGALVLGLISISTARFTLLMGWFVGQTLEMALAGAVIGSGLAGVRLRRLFGAVVGLVLVSVIAVVVLQTLGVAPSTRLERTPPNPACTGHAARAGDTVGLPLVNQDGVCIPIRRDDGCGNCPIHERHPVA